MLAYLQRLEVVFILTSVHYKQEYGRSYGGSLDRGGRIVEEEWLLTSVRVPVVGTRW